MTQRIFDDAPFQGTLTADILELTPCAQGFCAVLDKTIFFPRGGGQPCESGTIGGSPVLDVYEEEGRILHILAERPAALQGVECRIDLAQRLDHAQQHTGQHVISAVAQQMFDNPTLIARIEGGTSHIELRDPLSEEQLAALQRRVAQVVAQALPIRCTYYTPEEAARMEVRGKITPHERIRLVEIQGFDRNACGGTHCADTSQIGPVRWTGSKMVRGAFRLYFRAGGRAVLDAEEKDLRQLRLGGLLDCETGSECEQKIFALHSRAAQLEEDCLRLRQQLVAAQGEALLQQMQATGASACYRQLEGWETKDAKALCDSLTKQHPVLVALALGQGENLSVIVAQHKGMDRVHPGKLLKDFFTRHGGKGGGSAALAQGMVPRTPEAEQAFAELARQMIEAFSEAQPKS